jgi:hypothetical protein
MAEDSNSTEGSEDLNESPETDDRAKPAAEGGRAPMSRSWEKPRSAKRLGFQGLADFAGGDARSTGEDALRAGWKAKLAREGKQYHAGQSIGERLRREREEREAREREAREREAGGGEES